MQIASLGVLGFLPNDLLINSLHVAVQENRADVLQLLFTTSTDAGLNIRMVPRAELLNKEKKGQTPLQFAKKLKYKDCLKVIRSFVREGKKKTSVKEYGHVFDCC